MTTQVTPVQVPEITGLDSPTGYCRNRNHKQCGYRPGGATENGIALSDGGFYMCPCSCHAQQKHAVQGKRLQVSLAARKAAIAEQNPETATGTPATAADLAELADKGVERKSVVATILADHSPDQPAKPAKKTAETSPKSEHTQGKQSSFTGVGETAKTPRETKMTKTTADAIEITSIGPNGISDATFHVHAAGCADIKRGIKVGKGNTVAANYSRAEKNDMIVASFREMVEQDFADIMAENPDETWESYTNEYRIFPCVTFPEDRRPAALVEAAKAKVAKAKASSPAKAAKAAAAKQESLTTAEKRAVRVKMAAVLRAPHRQQLTSWTEREMAYVEAHWLKYIDPDLDKARREAAAGK
jgi:hypothetical protein